MRATLFGDYVLHASLKLGLSSRQHCESVVRVCSPPCSHTAIAVSVSLIAGDYHQTVKVSYSVVAARAPDVDTFVSWLGFHFGNTVPFWLTVLPHPLFYIRGLTALSLSLYLRLASRMVAEHVCS